jgi:hypothetical protein
MKIAYTCGGCGKRYASDTEYDGPTRATCPRCNPGKSPNLPVDEARSYKLVPTKAGRKMAIYF